jgi:hypothetical protein
VFYKLWQAGVERFDELKGIDWQWQSVLFGPKYALHLPAALFRTSPLKKLFQLTTPVLTAN